MSLHEAEQVASSLTYELDSQANVIWGARVRKDYEGKVRCMAIMTGIKSAQIMGPGREKIPSVSSSPAISMKSRVPMGRELNGVSIIDQIM
jgi:cell division protein FtsZ